MEFTSIIFNIFIGLVCLIMGIYGLKQKISISQNIGYTAIGFGIVGFMFIKSMSKELLQNIMKK